MRAASMSLWASVFLLPALGASCVDRVVLFDEPGLPSGGSDAGGSPGTAGAGGSSGGAGGLGGAPPVAVLLPGPSGELMQVEGGDGHTAAVVDGALYTWGDNSLGQLGLGDVSRRLSPTRVDDLSSWQAVGAGSQFTCGLRAGEVLCWGGGGSGQLGNGSYSGRLEPDSVALPGAARALGVGSEHACAILVDGSLHCWGANSEGQLGQDDPFPGAGIDSATAREVTPAGWSLVAAGQGHTCGVREDGSLWCWGRNSGGELGLGDGAPGQIRTPQRVGTAADWTAIAAGQGHGCGLRGAELHCWGQNDAGNLGLGDFAARTSPTLVPGLSGMTSLALDTFHTCVTTTSLELWCFGRTHEGQLGVPATTDLPSPVLVPSSGGTPRAVGVGRFHTCVVEALSSGERVLACTGAGDGRLGTGSADQSFDLARTQVSASPE